MDTNSIDVLYQQIADKLCEIVPDKWDKVYLYAEVLSDSRIVYFYLKSPLKNNFIYCHNIPSEYNVDECIYDEMHNELVYLFVKLNEEFRLNTPQAWTNLTMYLDASGKFSMDYKYDFIDLPPSKQRKVWAYKVLGIYPDDQDDKKFVEDYIRNHKD